MPDAPKFDYSGAVEQEQFQRNCAYLNLPETVCGEQVNNLTPHTLALLTAAKSPWIVGGNRLVIDEVFKTIWPLHIDYDARDTRTAKRVLKSLYSFGVYKCVDELDAYFETTFMDAEGGGTPEKPIAASVSWLVYTFLREPFYYPEEKTLSTPIRKLYQLQRCHKKYNGGDVMNPLSDKVRGKFFEWVNESIQRGDFTAEEYHTAQQAHYGK